MGLLLVAWLVVPVATALLANEVFAAWLRRRAMSADPAARRSQPRLVPMADDSAVPEP